MDNIDNTHDESKGSSPNTIELLASLFEELKEKNLSLSELGYSPYVIKEDNGESLLFAGAFYHKADAEKEHVELASKGIQARVVKR